MHERDQARSLQLLDRFLRWAAGQHTVVSLDPAFKKLVDDVKRFLHIPPEENVNEERIPE